MVGPDLKPGVYDWTNEEYHGLADAISRSWLKVLVHETPADFAWYRKHGIAVTDSMRLGNRIHTVVLEPREYLRRYARFPRPINRKYSKLRNVNSDEGVVWDRNQAKRYEEALRAKGIEILTDEDIAEDMLVAREVRSRKAVQLLTAGGHAERSLLWQDEKTGLWVKARPDWWDVKRGVYVDLKSTNRFDDRHLSRCIVDHCIDMQFAMVREGCKALGLPIPTSNIVLWVRTTKRPECRAEALDESILERGQYLFRKSLDLYAECLRSQTWPGEPPTIQPRSLSRWDQNYKDGEDAA